MRRFGWAVVAVLGLWAPAARATNGMRMIGFGPVQNAMGGASVGAPLDAATVITNPAGMCYAGGRVDFGATYFQPTVKYEATGAASGAEVKSDRGPSPIPALGIVIPLVPSRLAFGVGAYGVAGMGVDYPQDLYGSKTYTSYSQMRFAPGLSYRIVDGLSVGVTANLMYATMEYTAGGMQPRDTSSALGLGATLGLSWTPVAPVTLGLAYETKSTFQDFEFNVPQHQLTTAAGTVTVPGGVEKLAFDQPSSVTAGVGVRPIDGLVLVADLEWIRWSETNGKDQPEFQTDPNVTGAMSWNMDWDDQWVVKVGAQYAALPWLKVRAGWNYGKNPLNADRAFENVAFPAVAEHHFTGGLGLDLGKFSVNVGGMYAPEVKVSGSNPDQYLASYSTKMSQYAVDAGVGYRF